MVRLSACAPVPSTPDERLDELAEILARGVLRMQAKKEGFCGENRLEVHAETRLSVTTSDETQDREVT